MLRRAICALLVIFALSVVVRSGSLGKISTAGHDWGSGSRTTTTVLTDGYQWVTASSLAFLNVWKQDGFWHDKGALIFDPASPELGLGERVRYASYSPLFLVPVHLISKIMGLPPSVGMLHVWNLLLHLLGALLVGLIVYRITKPLGEKYQLLGFLCGSCAYIFQYQMMYFLSVVYFADIAMLPIYLLIILNYQAREKNPRSLRLYLCEFALFFAAALTDWFSVAIFLTLLIMLYFKRGSRFKRAVEIALPFVLGWEVFLLQLSATGGLQMLYSRFLNRTGIVASDSGIHSIFNNVGAVMFTYVGRGVMVLLLVGAAVLYALHREKARKEFSVDQPLVSKSFLFLIVMPPFIHTLLLSNHSFLHEFSALKFFVPFCIIACAVLPTLLLYKLRNRLNHSRIEKLLIVALAAAPLIYVAALAPEYARISARYTKNNCESYYWLRDLARPGDVILSNMLDVGTEPPQGIAITEHRVWVVSSQQALASWLAAHPGARGSPLLWIEKFDARTNECLKLYKSLGGAEVSRWADMVAIRFASVQDFAAKNTPSETVNCP